MFSTINKKSLFFASAMLLATHSTTHAQSDLQEVTINFAAYVGQSEFACGESYEGVGIEESTITPTDFRFYVSDVALIDEDGNAVPLELEQDGKWQYQNTALLDFENGTNACDNGTPAINTVITGTVPEGDYQDLQFTMGVPQKLNHDDAAIAPSPLNLTSMWWNWQAGYKFMRVEFETESPIANVAAPNERQNGVLVNEQSTTHTNHEAGTHTHQTSKQASIFQNGEGEHRQASRTQISHGEGEHSTEVSSDRHNKHQNASSNSYMIHLGSTGCSDSAQSSLFDCKNPNRVRVTLEDFDPDGDVVIADLGELLAQSNLTVNDANTPNGCMSSPEDADCAPIMQNLDLAASDTEESDSISFSSSSRIDKIAVGSVHRYGN